MVLQLKTHIIVVEICEWSGWEGEMLFLVSSGVSSIIDPSGTAPTSEPAIDSTPLHQPTPIHTGMLLVAIINTCSTCYKYQYIISNTTNSTVEC